MIGSRLEYLIVCFGDIDIHVDLSNINHNAVRPSLRSGADLDTGEVFGGNPIPNGHTHAHDRRSEPKARKTPQCDRQLASSITHVIGEPGIFCGSCSHARHHAHAQRAACALHGITMFHLSLSHH